MPPKITPVDYNPFAVGQDVMDNVRHVESRGNPNAVSPKGAVGDMQTMPGTLRNPGFGVTPARDNSPEELNRVGKDYLDAMYAKYGDMDKALAAYNHGPGNVDNAIAKHGDNWKRAIPQETAQYIDDVKSEPAAQAPKITPVDYNPFADEATEPAPPPTKAAPKSSPKKPWLQAIGDQYKENFRKGADLALGTVETPLSLVTGTLAWPISKVAGSVAFGVTGSGETARKVKEYTSNLLSYQPKTESGRAATGLAGNIANIPMIPSQWADKKLTKAGYPNIGYAVGDMGETLTMALLPKVLKKTSEKMLTKPSQPVVEQAITKAVDQGVKKGIAPSIVKQRDFQQTQHYYSQAKEAVTDIVSRKDNISLTDSKGNTITGKVPRNLSQMAEAIDQGKRQVFQEYDAMKTEAGEQGASVDLGPLSQAYREAAADRVLQIKHPEIAREMNRLADAYEEAGAFTVDETQNAIQMANRKLEAVKRAPTFDTASQAVIEQLGANILRKSLDAAIESEQGAGYQALKNKYSAYKTIEADVSHRRGIDARKRPQGLFDLSNIATASEAAKAVVTLSPSNAAAAVAMHGVKRWIKHEIDPNTHINRMFSNVERAMKDRQLPQASPEPFTLDRTFYDAQLGMPQGRPYDAYMASSRPPAVLGSQALVPTGRVGASVPGPLTIPLPSDASMLLRHPMGNKIPVPTGIKYDYFPTRETSPVTPEKLNIVRRRYEGNQAANPGSTLTKAEKARLKLRKKD